MMRLAYVNLGCPKNQIDLEYILGGVQAYCTLTDSINNADAVLINTCAFIKNAKEESIGEIFKAVAHRQQNPDLKIFVSGCLPQRYKETLKTELPEVNHFFQSTDAFQTQQQLLRYLTYQNATCVSRKKLSPSHYAYLQIADGCNNRCSYCAIPLIKGKYKSRPFDDIINEAQQLAASGTNELILVAQDSTMYGQDLKTNKQLSDLLCALDEISGFRWIRLMYTHPAHWNDQLIDTMADLEKVVNYVDMPIQHISEPVLKRMGRRVTRQDIVNVIQKLRRKLDNVTLRTTVITGFPGETDDHFKELLSFLEDVQFDRLGAFTYSHEEGTRAFEFYDDVPPEVKVERQQEIMELHAGISLQHNEEMVGQRFTVIVDEYEESNNLAIARTQRDAPDIDNTVLLFPDVKVGHFYDVIATAADTYDLEAQVIVEC